MEALGIPPETVVVERGDVARAKPEPDLFLACAERLGVAAGRLLRHRRRGLGPARGAARRMLCVGLLSGGYGEGELTAAGAYRVYRDADELRRSLDELGVPP